MSKPTPTIKDYFRPPPQYYWQWADHGNVIEWREGDTICYRDELTPVLKHIAQDGIASFGAVLLIMDACRGKQATQAAIRDISYGALCLLDYFEKNKALLAEAKPSMLSAIRLLGMITALPADLRMGHNRAWLLYILFKKLEGKIVAGAIQRFIDAFDSGKYDHYIFKEEEPVVTAQPGLVLAYFKEDMSWLEKAGQAFPNTEALELAVRTGMQELPGVATIQVPQPETGDLLQQLEQDPVTAGLAQLTHRLIAALNIPMHAHGSSDQLFGGVSDITNRGNFDRLLLSELAHDDLSLMARLANNEALYLRREELPSHPEKQRILLVDTTIKMWGLPRVFAISAALACARNNKAKARVLSYALSGNKYNGIDLASKPGIVSALEQLDAALHCGRAVTQFMNQEVIKAEDEVFLITEEEATHSVLFQSILSSLKKPVNFLVTVNRSGHLQFYEYIKNRKKLLSEARFNLQELLFTVKKKKVSGEKRDLLNVPAFMKLSPAPLYYPASKIKFNAECFFEFKKDHLLCVTMDQRVLYWDSRTKGARELIEQLEPGNFCFGTNWQSIIYLLVASGGGANQSGVYEISPELNYVEFTKLPETLNRVRNIVYEGGHFYFQNDGQTYSVAAATGKLLSQPDASRFSELHEAKKLSFPNMNYFKRHINDGYTTINKVREVYINGDGDIGFDDRHITFRLNGGMIIIDHNRSHLAKCRRKNVAKEAELPVMDSPNANLRFVRFVWADGSEVLIDSRGLMHLRSSDASIPEITIIMVMGKATACWASDGRVAGLPYFTGVDTGESRDVAGFYYNYIQRFIDALL